jgi:Concanavalin A-like lectin/glucanases superfamily
MARRICSTLCLPVLIAALLTAMPASAVARHRAQPPSVSTCCASGVTSSSATLSGSVDPNGSSTSYWFQYGASSSYGSTTQTTGMGSGTSLASAQATVSGLAAGTTFHFRLVASNALGTRYGSDITFTTPGTSPPPPPSSSYDAAIQADNPVALWDMNNPGGSEADQSGNGHSGTYVGGTPQLTSMPNGDRAVDFNGSTEYLTVPSSAAFSIPTTHQLTWEGWIRPDVLQWTSSSDPYGYGYVDWMGKCENYSPSCEWEARMYASVNSENRCNRLSAYVFKPSAGLGSGADWQPSCNLLQAGQWLHVVGEYQTQTTPSACNSAYPGTINIWVNGVEWNPSYHYPTGCMSQYSITPQAGSSPLDIGTMAMDTWFPGAVGKVAIYSYLLSQSQIDSHFAAMTRAQPSGSCASSCTTPVPTQ